VTQLDERHANRTTYRMCWSGKTDTEHGSTSGSNEEEVGRFQLSNLLNVFL